MMKIYVYDKKIRIRTIMLVAVDKSSVLCSILLTNLFFYNDLFDEFMYTLLKTAYSFATHHV